MWSIITIYVLYTEKINIRLSCSAAGLFGNMRQAFDFFDEAGNQEAVFPIIRTHYSRGII
jgi:hypothetical protein